MTRDYVLEALSKELMHYLNVNSLNKEKIEEAISKIDFHQMCNDVLNKLSDNSVEQLKESMHEIVHNEKENTQLFLTYLNQKYNKGFVASETMYILVTEAGKEYCDFVNKLDFNIVKDKQFLFVALKGIHSRACQQYDEILCLITNGFADGALARWRSLYELSIIAYFIAEKGEEVAESFISCALSNDRYDWAKVADCFKNTTYKHISFGDILKNCNYETSKWKNIYNTANKLVHASPQGTFDRLGRGSASQNLPVGRSDYGLKLPAEAAALSLNVINEIFLNVFPNGKSALSIHCINKWTDIISEYYLE